MIYDVAIIGAGPCGLAVAARLRERYPSALFTDIEHARFWGRAHDKNTVDNEHKDRRSDKSKLPNDIREDRSIIVFDAHSDTWMSAWRSKFKALKITHLRSPLFFHPDPQDRDGLLAFSHFEGRTDELREIQNVVGKEVSKHKQKKRRNARNGNSHESARHLHLDNRDRNDYFTPSSALFEAYIDSIVERYDLTNLIQHTNITNLTYDNNPHHGSNLFTLTTSNKSTYLARTVILATGPLNKPQIPPSLPLLSPPNTHGSATHIFTPNVPLLPAHILNKQDQNQATKILIVGGGLTSAQITDLLLSTSPLSTHKPITQIHLTLRSKLKTKHFDVDLPWVSKLRNREMASFWSADTDTDRSAMLSSARNGGSITPTYDKILREWTRQGRLQIHVESEIDCDANSSGGGTHWNEESKTWHVSLKSSTRVSCDVSDVDHIIFATSTPPRIENIPFLESLSRMRPVESVNGLPVLTQDLGWSGGVPLFVTGALAGLRLGPGAGNLAGARLGAERVAWAVDALFASEFVGGEGRRDSGYESLVEGEWGHEKEKGGKEGGSSSSGSSDLWRDYRGGLGGMFEGLALLDGDDEIE